MKSFTRENIRAAHPSRLPDDPRRALDQIGQLLGLPPSSSTKMVRDAFDALASALDPEQVAAAGRRHALSAREIKMLQEMRATVPQVNAYAAQRLSARK